MDASATCFSLTEKLEPLFFEYGEEQILASLYFIMQRRLVELDVDEDDNMDLEPILLSRMEDLEELNQKWELENDYRFL